MIAERTDSAERGWARMLGTGGALRLREPPPDVTALVPAPRREVRPFEPDREDLLDVRLHAPTPEIVIVRVAGPLDPRTSALLSVRVRQQFRRARHVILDLSSVTWLDPRVGGELGSLHAEAVSCGARLYVAADNKRVVEGLRRIDPGRHIVLGSADAVLASLARRGA
jgi:anti-anti-sigma regulatory factor